jgi:hypothetical protein
MNSNLEKEIKSYSEFSKQSEQTASKIYLFFKSYAEEGVKGIDKSKKILEEFFSELRKEPSSTTNNVGFLGLYNDVHRYLESLKNIYLSIEKNIVEKLAYMVKKIQYNQNIGIERLNKLSLIMDESRLKLDKYKHNYFNACKIVIEQEKKIINLKDNKKIKEEDFSKNNDTLSKYVLNLENQEGIYKGEIKKLNKIIETCEEAYPKIAVIFKDEYSYKLNCILNGFKDFKTEILKMIELNKDLITKIDKVHKCISVDRDIQIFSEQNNYMNENKKRFLLEKFLDYKLLRNTGLNDDKNASNNLALKKLQNINDTNKFMKILNLGKINEEKIEFKNEEENTVNNYLISLLKDENKLDNEKYKYISDFINNSSDNINIVVNILLNQCKKGSFISIVNIDNLYLLSDLLNTIISIALNKDNIFELCYISIFIAEKSIYFNKDNIYNKCYLSKVISQNEIFSDSKFWEELIVQKINIVAEIRTKIEIEKRVKEKNEAKAKKRSKIMGMFGFSNDKNKENEIFENEILFKQIYEEKLPLYSVEVIEDYINHFSNFNFEQKKASQLILEMAEKYKFDDSFVTYFMAKLNSNMWLSKEDILKNKNNYEKELKQLDYDQLYFNSSNNGSTIKYKRVLDPKLRGLIYSLRYIEIKDFPNLLSINKNYYKTLVKIIYKNILIKYHDMDIQNHIKIWKILLNYSEIKKLYDYKQIKKELNIDDKNINGNLEEIRNSKDIIDLDIIRTNFDTNKEINQLKISYILKALRYTKNNLKYCQGMNYIAAFLLNVMNDEEEAFYLFLSIFGNTDYGKLFVKDLEKLKKFFYVFGRLLNVLLPELDFYLKDNKIDVSYFVSPWFITLFTNTFPNIKDKNNPKILLRIFDLFFFSGWKSIIKIGISLLKNYESTIMTLTFEELLHFLINNILKSDFFQKENYEQLMQISINFKIKNSLISDIENEYEMKKKLEKFGQKFSTDNIKEN